MNSSCPDRDISIKKAVLLLFLASKSASSSRPDMSRSVMNISVTPRFDGKISSLKVKIGDKVSKGSILASIENDEKKENISIIKKEEDKKKTIIKK